MAIRFGTHVNAEGITQAPKRTRRTYRMGFSPNPAPKGEKTARSLQGSGVSPCKLGELYVQITILAKAKEGAKTENS